jgi:hypothetical protein
MIGSTANKLKNVFRSSQKLLRGTSDAGEDGLSEAATVISDTKDMLKSSNDQMKLLQNQLKQGNNDAATSTLKDIAKELQLQQDGVQSELELRAPLAHLDSTFFDVTGKPHDYWEGVPPSELLETELLLGAITDANDLAIDVLEDVHVSVSNVGSSVDEDKERGEHGFEGVDSGFSSNAFFSIPQSSSVYAAVGKAVRDKTEGYRHSLKKHSPEGQDERHLQRTADHAQCKPGCSLDDKACNCAELKRCANMMGSYDKALSIFGGYVNTVGGDPEYGNFTVQNLKLFDIGGSLSAKMSKIKSLAQESGDDCTSLLSEFTTLCEPEATSCSSTNEYSHQLTIQQVCDRVDNSEKLLISAM